MRQRLRPLLGLLAYESLTGDHRQALPGAAAVELGHNFSLVHDDIEDGDTERHHRPTLWTLHGVAQAINTGDTLFSLSRLALYRLLELGFPPAKVLGLMRLYDETCLALCEGQFMDIWSAEHDEALSVDFYFDMIGRKTAALIAASIKAGANVKVLRSADPGANGNAFYVLFYESVVPGTEYSWLDIINKTLTSEYLQHELNEALKLYGANGCPATIGDSMAATMERFNYSGLLQVSQRPCNPVGKRCLSPARHEFLQIRLGQAKFAAADSRIPEITVHPFLRKVGRIALGVVIGAAIANPILLYFQQEKLLFFPDSINEGNRKVIRERYRAAEAAYAEQRRPYEEAVTRAEEGVVAGWGLRVAGCEKRCRSATSLATRNS